MSGILLSEYEIMLNPALGANALWAFTHGFVSENKKDLHSLSLWHLVTVLPLVYHEVTRKIIIKRRASSGLRSILERDSVSSISQNEVIFNINSRLKSMENRTFRSINLAILCDLIKVQDGYFLPNRPFKIPTNTPNETMEILKSSKKLGGWAGNMSEFEYLTVLGVKPIQ